MQLKQSFHSNLFLVVDKIKVDFTLIVGNFILLYDKRWFVYNVVDILHLFLYINQCLLYLLCFFLLTATITPFAKQDCTEKNGVCSTAGWIKVKLKINYVSKKIIDAKSCFWTDPAVIARWKWIQAIQQWSMNFTDLFSWKKYLLNTIKWWVPVSQFVVNHKAQLLFKFSSIVDISPCPIFRPGDSSKPTWVMTHLVPVPV